jgi:itaconate CoA-transferase
MERMGTLDGILVVALEHAVAVPFATRQLADLGARVVKIERPGVGDFARGYDRTVHGQSSHFVWLNRGKESVELDIKEPADRAILDRLIARADVFVQNLGPGAIGRLGLDADTLRARHPRLVTCAVSGYGSTGPYATKKAYDLLLQCEAGLVEVTGTPDETVKVGISVADIAAGMYTLTGILTALYERERTGLGTSMEVPLLDALGEWMTQPVYWSVYGGEPVPRTGTRHASIAPYGPYRTGDGDRVYVAVQNDWEWATLCDVVLQRADLAVDPRFAHNPERFAHDDEITSLLETAFRRMTAEDVVALLDTIGIATGRMRPPEQLMEHPQLTARDRWRDVDTPGGSIRALLPPVAVAGREATMRAVPRLGEHTDRVRAEFGGSPAVATNG